MVEKSETTHPVPAIVIAAGEFAVTTAVQVQHIYLRGDSNREKLTRFYALVVNEKDEITLVNLQDAIELLADTTDAIGEEYRPEDLRHAFFLKTIQSQAGLRNALERHLHSIYAHEMLIKSGMAGVYDVAVNIYLLADVKDPFAAGVLLPFSFLLKEAAETRTLCKVHLLLNTAVFPSIEDNNRSDLALETYTFLQELDDLLQDQSELREKLINALHYENKAPLNAIVYLFDSNKEGAAVVTDNIQMQVMTGNALLALMQKNMAQQLVSGQDIFEVSEQLLFYNSIGSVAMIYDPDSLQKTCSQRISRKFLDEVILSAGADAQLVAKETKKIEEDLGSLRTWFEAITFQLPPAIGQIQLNPDTHELGVMLTNLKMKEIDFDRFQATPWTQQFKAYLEQYKAEIPPLVTEALNTNSARMHEESIQKLSTVINRMPSQPGLYPGGIQNAANVLGLLETYVAKIDEQIADLQTLLNEKEGPIDQEISEKLEKIQRIFDDAPNLPWLVRILPRFIRTWAAPAYYARRYGKQLVQVRMLQQECTRLVQSSAAIQIQKEAVPHISALTQQLQEQIAQGKADYTALRERITAAAEKLPVNWPDFPLGQAENGWDDIFRIPMAEIRLAEYSYAKWLPSLEKWTYDFLDKAKTFSDWRNTTPDAVTKCLDDMGLDAYQPVWTITLDEIMMHWATNPKEFWADLPITASMIITGMNSANPLLRPNYDAVGGITLTSISRHNLFGAHMWEYFKIPSTLPGYDQYEIVHTGDPYTALLICVRHSLPLKSLVEMTRAGKIRYKGLTDDDKRAYRIVHFDCVTPRPTIPEGTDPDNPDIVHKKFEWGFKPKGSGDEIPQSIALDVSLSRYEHYRRVPRFNGEWNRYAVEDMPEIRALAMEFQRLHASQKWSTYNQAFNVLKFVQTNIPYAYDKDTTGYEDWARYPIETIMDGKGDCEDVAILCAAIIARLGFQVVLLVYPRHVAFGVAGADKLKGDYVLDPQTGKKYFYGEATADGWHLGQIPKGYINVTPEILNVEILIDEND